MSLFWNLCEFFFSFSSFSRKKKLEREMEEKHVEKNKELWRVINKGMGFSRKVAEGEGRCCVVDKSRAEESVA